MSRWFRFHADAMRNPKVARLSDKEFRLWVELLAVACENDGFIAPLDDLKHVLKRRLDHLSTGVERLISIGLIDPLEGGYEPHGWAKNQYKSDVSTDRVQKHRAKRNVSETPPDTETDTDINNPIIPFEEKRVKGPAKPDGVQEQTWRDFLDLRRKKRAPVTETALAGLAREAAKAGWPLEQVLAESVLRGWQSFKSDWVAPVRSSPVGIGV